MFQKTGGTTNESGRRLTKEREKDGNGFMKNASEVKALFPSWP